MAQPRPLQELFQTAAYYAEYDPTPVLGITEEEVAQLSGFSVPALRKRRLQGKEPNFYKVGSLVRYDYFYIMDWLKSCSRTSTTAPVEA